MPLDPVTGEIIAAPLLLVMLMVCPVSRTVRVPFPMNVTIECVWFIGVIAEIVAYSSQIGCCDNCISDNDDDNDDNSDEMIV